MIRTWFASLPALLAASALVAAAEAATIERDCTLEAAGEACVYDIAVTAAPAGAALSLCSIPATGGARLRNTTAKLSTTGAVSRVGATTAGGCSGTVAQPVVAGSKYEAIITHETPLPGTFPRSAKARFSAPSGVAFTVTGPRPQTWVEPRTCTQVSETALVPTAADVDTIVCGDLFACRFDPAGDTDLFNWTVPAGTVGWIKIAGPTAFGSKWCLYKDGNLLKCASDLNKTAVLTAGTYKLLTREDYDYTGAYGLSLQGISAAYRCGPEIKCGDVRTGTFNAAADTDALIFRAAAPMTLDLKIVGPTAFGSKWCVFGPTGEPVGACSSGEATVSLPAAGTYIIGVMEDYQYTGGYRLSLQCL